MIVDDDPNIRELVSALLQNHGFEACEAADGRNALQKMTNDNPDMVIIDIMMPNMDGFELCRNLRKYYENMPILVLTAKGELASKVKCKVFPFYSYK
jgi:DNA-binding response OmpR family regulator